MAFKRCKALLEYKWRWDLGDYAVKGVFHQDCFGAHKGGGKGARAMIAGAGYKPWRDKYDATHTPHFKAVFYRGSHETNRVLYESHWGNHIPVAVSPRRMTREQFEEAEETARRNAARRGTTVSIPLLPFYTETAWRARYSRHYDKKQAQEEIAAQVKRSLPASKAKPDATLIQA